MYKYFLFLLVLFSCSENKLIENDPEKHVIIDYNFYNKLSHVNLDSLFQAEIKTKDDTVKVNNLISIFRLSIKNRPIRNDVLDEALIISKKINYQTGIANCLSKKGVNARYEHQYLNSLKLHKEALTYYNNSWDIYSRVKNLNSLGVTYRRLNMEEDAIKHHLDALKLSEKHHFKRSKAIAINGIGNAYATLKKYEDAKKYFHRSLKLNVLNKNERGKGYDYSNLGEVYMYLKQYDSAYYYQNKALEIAKKSKNKNDKAIVFSAMGLMFQHNKEWNKALDYYFKATPVLKNHNSKRLLSFSLINVGIVYSKLNEFDKAKKYIKSGLKLSTEISSKDNLVLGYEALSNLLELEGNSDGALKNYKSMVIYRDSIFNIQSENNIVAMHIKYDTEKKDENIKNLELENKINKSRNIILYLVVGILFILIVFSFIFIRMKMRNNDMMIDNMRNQIEEYVDQISNLKDAERHNLDKLEEYGLTSRELEVLNYITKGLKNQEIADKMYLSLSTIKTHTKNIFEKLDVRNRMEAARIANTV